MSIKPLHTLNARDHVMLEVARDHFNLQPAEMFFEIQEFRKTAENVLAEKSISYDKLKSVLVPDRKRKEFAFLFNSAVIKSYSYGYEVFKRIIPLFDKESSHSVLVGDLSSNLEHEALFDMFSEVVELKRSVDYQHPTQFFVVYVNNLTDSAIQRLDQGMKRYKPYVGLADMTFNSRFKICLSTCLVNAFIKHGTIILQGHEPDRDPSEDINMSGYPFEESGYVCRSVSDDIMGVLLSYKIERPVFSGFESDSEFALNAISSTPLPLKDLRIEVEEAKLIYVKSQKAGSLERAGLATVSSAELAAIIRQKISNSYIYNMAYVDEYKIMKFNVMLEFHHDRSRKATRLLAALEYRPKEKMLRLLTLY